ncbi:MAG: HAD-IC family P-type ATPase [Coriobacteriia bacterium]|nr:HAD-IC family P-type ATPase [Coriobacteriia bacterium]
MTEPATNQQLWYALSPEAVLEQLDSRRDGLSAQEAARRLAVAGPNALQGVEGPGLLSLVLKQLRSPLIYMLFAAAALSLAAGHPIDAVVVGLVLVLNTVIGVSQEWRAERSLEALRSMAAPRARVLRDGTVEIIPAADVVRGDILMLETGDLVGADARVIDVSDLRIDESALTGESDTVGKSVDALEGTVQLADQRNMVRMTTAVTDGRGRAVVVATGMETSIGEIAHEVQSAESDLTPLQKRLASLGTLIGIGAIGFATLVFVIGLLRGFPAVQMLTYAVAAAVSAIPEGLPAVISVVLAVGVQRMARRNAIVRNMPAVETLGSTTVICSDKTGTITRNEMTASRMWAGGTTFTVTGEGFSPRGAVLSEQGEPVAGGNDGATGLIQLLTIGALANNATLEHDEVEDRWRVEGNPTDGALLAVSEKGGLAPDFRECAERIDEIPFSSRFKYMASLDRLPHAPGPRMHVKGAFERILDASDRMLVEGREVVVTPELRRAAEQAAEDMAEQALRVVAGGYRDVDASEAERGDAESGLVFVGMWGLLDPPRPEAVAAVAAAQKAGIQIKMITGDHAVTAAAIARNAGIISHGEEVVTGAELDVTSDEELADRVGGIAVFARVSPTHKLRIVKALQKRGEVVAMTGDGVNDAPALKRADIGVSMGITGTEVAKESSDMILVDDDFATILAAVEEGRVIFGNLRRVVMFLLTTNLGEILLIIAALILDLPLPLTAVMILWVNLVTDGVSVVPLGLEPRHDDVLSRKPRPPAEGVLTRRYVTRIVVLAPVIGAGTLANFVAHLGPEGQLYAQTMAFTTLVAFEWFRAFSTRSLTKSVFTQNPFGNRLLLGGIGIGVVLQLTAVYWPPAQVAFGTVNLSARDWAVALAVGSTVLFVDEILKLVDRLRGRGEA